MGSKVGGAAPGFEPGTSCMRVRSHSHYATGAAPFHKVTKRYMLHYCIAIRFSVFLYNSVGAMSLAAATAATVA